MTLAPAAPRARRHGAARPGSRPCSTVRPAVSGPERRLGYSTLALAPGPPGEQHSTVSWPSPRVYASNATSENARAGDSDLARTRRCAVADMLENPPIRVDLSKLICATKTDDESTRSADLKRSDGRAQWQNPYYTKRLFSALVIRSINIHCKM